MEESFQDGRMGCTSGRLCRLAYPMHFMQLMTQVLQPFPEKFATVYLDDILIYRKNEGNHLDHLRQILMILQENKLYTISPGASYFWDL